MRPILPPLLALGLVAVSAPAHAQDACACARAVCESMRATQHRSAATCEGMSELPPSACTATAQDLVSRLRATGRAAPSSCNGVGAPIVIEGAVPTAPSNTGPMISRAPTPAPPPADRAPTALPADPPVVVASDAGRLACELDHDAERVVVAGAPVTFTVKCAGIPLPANPRGSRTPVAPPTRAADGRAVDVTWMTTAGDLAPEALTATWVPPATPPHPADVRVRATVTLVDGAGHNYESVVLTRTLHVVPRRLTLEVSSHSAARCGATPEERPSAYDVECHARIELDVSDDLRVRGREATPCETPVITNARSCGSGDTRVSAPGGFTISSAHGRIDPATGVLRLEVDGRATRTSTAAVAGSRRATARAARPRTSRTSGPLPRTLELAPDDGAVRSFGSFDPQTGAGSLATFTLRSR